ncbi:MAG: hypothetical protein GF341_09485 [candidate division Zixibacteria bacterium]|nr:hypothetical protein [candidate division Zixibacteria bacterium]
MFTTPDGAGWIRWLDNETRARMFIRIDSAGTGMVQFLEWPADEKTVKHQLSATGDTTLKWKR